MVKPTQYLLDRLVALLGIEEDQARELVDILAEIADLRASRAVDNHCDYYHRTEDY